MPMARIHGANIHYQDLGTGVPVLFVHPPLLNAANFRYQRAGLCPRCRVITFDIRGHGKSPYSEEPVTYPLIVSDIAGLVRQLDLPPVVLCGYSTGGGLALAFLQRYPELAAGAVLISAMPAAADWYNRLRLRLAIGACGLGMKLPVNLAISWGNADNARTFSDLFLHASAGDIRNWRQYYEASLLENCMADLEQVHHPVSLVYGLSDRPFHRYAAWIKHRLPQAELTLIQGVGHQIPTKAPEPLNTHIASWVMRVIENQAALRLDANQTAAIRAPVHPDGHLNPSESIPPELAAADISAEDAGASGHGREPL